VRGLDGSRRNDERRRLDRGRWLDVARRHERTGRNEQQRRKHLHGPRGKLVEQCVRLAIGTDAHGVVYELLGILQHVPSEWLLWRLVVQLTNVEVSGSSQPRDVRNGRGR
jgi:hypothetical protein